MVNIKNKSTNELLDELTSGTPLTSFISENSENFIETDLSETLNRILKEKGLTKSAVLKNAEINDIYGYQIFSGKRRPSRDKLIAISLGMKLSLEEVQALLKSAGFQELYPKFKRDSIIINCVCEEKNVFETNGILYNFNQDLLE